MKIRTLTTLSGFLAVVIAGAQEPAPNPAAFLVKISRSDLELSPHGINKNDCLLVLPDGHFHMEQRLQQLPETQGSLHIHESLLSNSQLEKLRSILSQRPIVKLPEFIPFPLPIAVNVRQGLQAEISRNQETVQSVGYMEWEPSIHDEAFEATLLQQSEVLAKSQEPAKTALDPLLQWFLDLESQPRGPDSGESTFCKIE